MRRQRISACGGMYVCKLACLPSARYALGVPTLSLEPHNSHICLLSRTKSAPVLSLEPHDSNMLAFSKIQEPRRGEAGSRCHHPKMGMHR